MGLFRPYEQGSSDSPADQTPASSRRGRRSGGATSVEQVRAQAATPAQKVVAAPVEQASAEARTDRRQPQKKGTRTPTRAEAEAARMARLHPTLSPKEAKKAERDAARQARMQNLDAVEASPIRKLARDHVDSRWTITEFTIPLMLAVMVLSIGFASNLQMQRITSGLMVLLFLLWILNAFVVWRSFKKVADERGLEPKQRGMFMYVINRMMTLRQMRRPAPAVKRGEDY